MNNQAPAPGAPPPTALEQAKAFLALFDASLATSFPGTGVSMAAFNDGCYLDDGITKPVSIALFDVNRSLSGEENKFRVGSTRTNVQVLAERNTTNPDGSKRREIDVAGETRARFLRRDDFEKLLLPRGAADGGKQLVRVACRFGVETLVHGQGFITTVLPAGKPSLSAGTRIQPSLHDNDASGQ